MNAADMAVVCILIGAAAILGVLIGTAISTPAYVYRTRRRELEHAERMAVLAQQAERERALLSHEVKL